MLRFVYFPPTSCILVYVKIMLRLCVHCVLDRCGCMCVMKSIQCFIVPVHFRMCLITILITTHGWSKPELLISIDN